MFLTMFEWRLTKVCIPLINAQGVTDGFISRYPNRKMVYSGVKAWRYLT